MEFDIQAASKRTIDSMNCGALSAFVERRCEYMKAIQTARTIETVRALRNNWNDCEHLNAVDVARKDSLGRVFAKRICTSCATELSGHLKRDLWFNSKRTLYMTDELKSHRASCWKAHVDRINALKSDETMSWWDRYDDYLRSPTWREMRAKVLERDGLTCQGCLVAPATEVHHTTYHHYNARRDMAFALVSLCASCHDAIHNH